MCKCLLEKILQVEEMNSNEVEVGTLPCVRLLHAFCQVDPSLCAPASDLSQFVVTLQPYLKSQIPVVGFPALVAGHIVSSHPSRKGSSIGNRGKRKATKSRGHRF